MTTAKVAKQKKVKQPKAPEKVTIDFEPLEEFSYNQISNYKFEFMLLTPDFKVVHSPFECKDYLQDIFWCEHNNKRSSIYGLSWKPGMFDVHAPFFYLALSGGSEILNVRIPPLTKFLNTFEEALGIEPTVIHETENPKIIVLKFSKDWTINGPMLSAYTTLIRAAGSYQDGDVLEYLQNLVDKKISCPHYVNVERLRLEGGNLKKVAALLQGKRPVHKWEDTTSIGGAHSNGITEFSDFPRVSLPTRA